MQVRQFQAVEVLDRLLDPALGLPLGDGLVFPAGLSEKRRPAVGLRISPHFFNTDEEVNEAMKVLAELVG